ncbi:hypothetical protein ADUPG1_000017 [Aduncisulcus paluster]|uniref:Uncharacterized protein n=1 Tax=Aduncisulcus paluster TaxID=2918883 RepID=A0ABQ5K479_9EUKA|nr:hypothetical protein ADUPG1_000017 [Aduncisulcus paluster]
MLFEQAKKLTSISWRSNKEQCNLNGGCTKNGVDYVFIESKDGYHTRLVSLNSSSSKITDFSTDFEFRTPSQRSVGLFAISFADDGKSFFTFEKSSYKPDNPRFYSIIFYDILSNTRRIVRSDFSDHHHIQWICKDSDICVCYWKPLSNELNVYNLRTDEEMNIKLPHGHCVGVRYLNNTFYSLVRCSNVQMIITHFSKTGSPLENGYFSCDSDGDICQHPTIKNLIFLPGKVAGKRTGFLIDLELMETVVFFPNIYYGHFSPDGSYLVAFNDNTGLWTVYDAKNSFQNPPIKNLIFLPGKVAGKRTGFLIDLELMETVVFFPNIYYGHFSPDGSYLVAFNDNTGLWTVYDAKNSFQNPPIKHVKIHLYPQFNSSNAHVFFVTNSIFFLVDIGTCAVLCDVHNDVDRVIQLNCTAKCLTFFPFFSCSNNRTCEESLKEIPSVSSRHELDLRETSPLFLDSPKPIIDSSVVNALSVLIFRNNSPVHTMMLSLVSKEEVTCLQECALFQRSLMSQVVSKYSFTCRPKFSLDVGGCFQHFCIQSCGLGERLLLYRDGSPNKCKNLFIPDKSFSSTGYSFPRTRSGFSDSSILQSVPISESIRVAPSIKMEIMPERPLNYDRSESNLVYFEFQGGRHELLKEDLHSFLCSCFGSFGGKPCVFYCSRQANCIRMCPISPVGSEIEGENHVRYYCDASDERPLYWAEKGVRIVYFSFVCDILFVFLSYGQPRIGEARRPFLILLKDGLHSFLCSCFGSFGGKPCVFYCSRQANCIRMCPISPVGSEIEGENHVRYYCDASDERPLYWAEKGVRIVYFSFVCDILFVFLSYGQPRIGEARRPFLILLKDGLIVHEHTQYCFEPSYPGNDFGGIVHSSKSIVCIPEKYFCSPVSGLMCMYIDDGEMSKEKDFKDGQSTSELEEAERGHVIIKKLFIKDCNQFCFSSDGKLLILGIGKDRIVTCLVEDMFKSSEEVSVFAECRCVFPYANDSLLSVPQFHCTTPISISSTSHPRSLVFFLNSLNSGLVFTMLDPLSGAFWSGCVVAKSMCLSCCGIITSVRVCVVDANNGIILLFIGRLEPLLLQVTIELSSHSSSSHPLFLLEHFGNEMHSDVVKRGTESRKDIKLLKSIKMFLKTSISSSTRFTNSLFLLPVVSPDCMINLLMDPFVLSNFTVVQTIIDSLHKLFPDLDEFVRIVNSTLELCCSECEDYTFIPRKPEEIKDKCHPVYICSAMGYFNCIKLFLINGIIPQLHDTTYFRQLCLNTLDNRSIRINSEMKYSFEEQKYHLFEENPQIFHSQCDLMLVEGFANSLCDLCWK